MTRRVTPRPFVIARLVLAALVAQLSLAAVCDATCASPAERSARATPSTVGAHGGHCQAPGSAGSRAQASHHMAPCQHESEPSARAAESRLSGRHDLSVVSLVAVMATPFGSTMAPPSSDRRRAPRAQRAARPLVLRI